MQIFAQSYKQKLLINVLNVVLNVKVNNKDRTTKNDNVFASVNGVFIMNSEHIQ